MAGVRDGYGTSKSMRVEAARALAWRREHGRGGVAVGVARARDLSNGRNVSLDTAKRMRSFFARHEIDRNAEGWRPGEKGFPSAGRVAWGLWGGDPGRVWADRVVAQHDRKQRRLIRKAAALNVLNHPPGNRPGYDVVEIAKLSWAQQGQRKNASVRARRQAFQRRHANDLSAASTAASTLARGMVADRQTRRRHLRDSQGSFVRRNRRTIAVGLASVGLLGSAKLLQSPSARAGLADSFENPRRGMLRGRAAVGAAIDTAKPRSLKQAARLGRAKAQTVRQEQRATQERKPYIGEGLAAFEDALTSQFKHGYRRRLPVGLAGYRAARNKQQPNTGQTATPDNAASQQPATEPQAKPAKRKVRRPRARSTSKRSK